MIISVGYKVNSKQGIAFRKGDDADDTKQNRTYSLDDVFQKLDNV